MELHNGSNRMSEIYFALCKGIDTPISLGAWMRYAAGEHLQLAKLSIQPDWYLTAEGFKKDYLVSKFLSKWKGLNTGVDLEAEAIQSFKLSEVRCRTTNERLRNLRMGRSASSPLTAAVLYSARIIIAEVLGPFTWRKIRTGYGWGPGATDDLKARHAQVDLKVSKLPISCTYGARAIFQRELRGDLHWLSVVLGVDSTRVQPCAVLPRDALALTSGCVITTVPKDAKTDRVIAKEPRANGFLQKGFGSFIRGRLKRYGINLDSQVPNQEGARRALIDGLATLDLKSASDSVATELIYELFPVDWALALDDCRSKTAILPDGSTVKLEKFSSMGNGFTFEVETLVFWALLSALRDQLEPGGEVLVYGDDIVLPKSIAEEAKSLLDIVGFEVNGDKSFVSGQFYESCGRHFFGGYDVTPIYQKELINDPLEVVRLGNRIMRCAVRFSYSGEGLWPLLQPAWRAVRRCDKTLHRFSIPLGTEGDDGWLLPMSEFPVGARDPSFGLRCKVYSMVVQRLPAKDDALFAWTLRRGVKTEIPYNGMLVLPATDNKGRAVIKSGARWVNPTGEFALEY